MRTCRSASGSFGGSRGDTAASGRFGPEERQGRPFSVAQSYRLVTFSSMHKKTHTVGWCFPWKQNRVTAFFLKSLCSIVDCLVM